MGRPLRIYLETTTWQFVANPFVATVHRDQTRLFFRELVARVNEPWIGDIVIQEANSVETETLRETMLAGLRRMKPGLLRSDEAVLELARFYVESGIFPAEHLRSALHVAAASVHEMDVLATWDVDLFCRLAVKRKVNGVNQLTGYKPLEMTTPAFLIEDPTGAGNGKGNG